MENDNQVQGLARTTAWRAPVGFSAEERGRHVWIVGKTGSGKSTLLANLIQQDILAGEGVVVIDPHGDLAREVADSVPPGRTHEVCYLDVNDADRPVGFNPLAGVAVDRRATAALSIVAAFRHVWPESWGQRLEHFLTMGLLTLLGQERSTLLDLRPLFTQEGFRERAIRLVADEEARAFWRDEWRGYDTRFRNEAVSPILNRIGAFAASPQVRAIIGQVAPKFDLATALDRRQIVIANLAKGVIGERSASLLGSLLVSQVQHVAMARAVLPEGSRVPFHCHIDEVQSFATTSFAAIFSEIRKMGGRFVIANQFVAQLSPEVRAAVMGNVGSIVAFRVGSEDAALLVGEFEPLPASELTGLPPFQARLRRSDGRHMLIETAPRLQGPAGRLGVVVAQSRRNFGRRWSAVGPRTGP